MALSSPARVDAALQAAARPVATPVPVHVPHRAVTPVPPQDVRVVLAVPRFADDAACPYEHLPLLPDDDNIQDIKLRLRNKGWFASRQCLVFGDRELAHRALDMAAASSAAVSAGDAHDGLHVFVKLSDIDQVDLRTLKREVSLCAPANQDDAAGCLLPLVAVPPRAAPPPTQTVVHLMVHKAARVNWHHLGEDSFELSISASDTVEQLMAKLEAAHGSALDADKHRVVYDGRVLSSDRPLAAYGIGTGSVLELVPHEPPRDAGATPLPDGSPLLSSPAHLLHEHWQRACAGLAGGAAPQLAPAGTGGSYFLRDPDGNCVAVFKPQDEEPLAANNPKGHGSAAASASSDGSSTSSTSSSGVGSSSCLSSSSSSSSSSGGGGGISRAVALEGLRRGTRPGEGAVREVAAYVLDHGHFSGVPPTALVSCTVNRAAGGAVKVGSLQAFVPSAGDCEERGAAQFPTQEVHKVAVLDMRLANTDRNGSNILCVRDDASSSWRLVPIDHGYTLPASFEDISFEWMWWPQAEQPFGPETLAYIAALDADADVAILEAHGLRLRPECVRVFKACTLALKRGAAAGLTPAAIASIMCRGGVHAGSSKSVLERLHANALVLAAGAAGGGSVPAPGCLSGDAASAAGADAHYWRQLDKLLLEYLEDAALEGAELLF